MAQEFANLRDAGRRLATPLEALVAGHPDAVLAPLLPNGVPVVLGLLTSLHLPVVPLPASRTHDGVEVEASAALAGRTVVVVDDGVETGTAARAAVPALRDAGAAHLVLAVPVCPREAMAHLALMYDDVVTVATPMVRRSLAWHYEEFDTVDETEALRLLGDLPS